jgi:hypothetical protein
LSLLRELSETKEQRSEKMKTNELTVDSILAVSGWGAFAVSAATKKARSSGSNVLCRPRKGTVREVRPDGIYSQVEFRADGLYTDMGEKIDTTGKGLVFHFAAIDCVREYANG